MRRVRDERERCVPLGLGGRELLLGDLELRLDGLELLQLLGRRLPLELRPRAELVDLRDQLAPALVGGEQRVEVLGRALAREGNALRVRIGAGGLEVDHGRV